MHFMCPMKNLACKGLTCLCVAGSYRQFHLYYEQGEFQEAASLLISLITDRLAPQRYVHWGSTA